jgi:hypothetical protein
MPMKPGPHVAMGLICEKVLEEKDGVLTIVRVIDRLNIQVMGAGAQSSIPAGVQYTLTLVVSLKSGDARGRNTLGIWPELPSGERLPRRDMAVHFEGEDRGINAVFQIGLPVAQEGLYWFDVLLGDQVLTRIPLRIVYQPIETATTLGQRG